MRVCLITGASEGLGLELARQFKENNWTVIGLARNRAKLQILQESKVLDDYFVCDLSNEAAVDQFIADFENCYSRLDKLILNAGIQHQYSITETSGYYSILRNELQVNYLTPVKIVSALLPVLIHSQGHVIGISSLLQLGPKPTAPGYSASKAALSNWLHNLRFQLRSHSVNVTEVIPGLIKTGMSKEAQIKGINPGRLAHIICNRNEREILVMPGARIPWFISRFCPGFIQKKIMQG